MATRGDTDITKLIVYGFVAGFASTLIFHQSALWVLWKAGFSPFAPFALRAVPPLGLPAFVSLAFWGGVWGILLTYFLKKLSNPGYWPGAVLFGAFLPSLVAWLVVLPLKGMPAGGGWQLPMIATGLLINGIWGFGVALILKLLAAVKSPGLQGGRDSTMPR